MPFDIFTLAAVCDQLTDTVLGGRIDKIIQPSCYSIALKTWAKTQSHWLLLSADPQHARVYLTNKRLAKGVDTPGSFVMLLRKYGEGGRIVGVRQHHLERILTLDIVTHAHGPVSLVAEIMGNRSNIILVAANGEVLGALKLISARRSRVRRILPHERYLPPPAPPRSTAVGGAGPRLDPLCSSESPIAATEIEAALRQAPPDLAVRDALVGLLQGCSPSIAADIATRANIESNAALGTVDLKALVGAIREQYNLLITRVWQPIVIVKDGVPVDYRAYAFPPLEGAEPASDISTAIERVKPGLESTDALKSARQRLHLGIAKRRNEITHRLAALEEELQHATAATALREAGELILAYQYQLTPGATHLVLPELERDIPLDPQLSPVENAVTYFKRYRKACNAAAQLPPLIENARLELAFLNDLDTYVDLAETERDLTRVSDELASHFGSREVNKKRLSGPGEPLCFELDSGAQVLIGRNARQNEQVTFKLAGRDDLWLHARGVPGAHVVLRGPNVQDEAICRAAELAAYFSKARYDSAVDVDVTKVRNVHRLRGGSPGQVTYHHERTVRVTPVAPMSKGR